MTAQGIKCKECCFWDDCLTNCKGDRRLCSHFNQMTSPEETCTYEYKFRRSDYSLMLELKEHAMNNRKNIKEE